MMSARKLLPGFILSLAVMAVFCYVPNSAVEANTRVSAIAVPQTRENGPSLVLEAGGHLAVIRALLFTADGRELVSAGDDKTIRVWSVSADGR
jgi:WD40 repeat protein